MRFWHYTTEHKLRSISADGTIRRASVFVADGERRAVWLSCRSTWEPTATKLAVQPGREPRRATLAEMVKAHGRLVRLEVPERLARHTWKDHRRIGQIDPRMADSLERAAREQGADPADWRVSYHDIPITAVLSVELSEDGVAWLPSAT